MSKQLDEMLRIAAEQQKIADEATLPLVRARALYSAEQWRIMAERQERIDAQSLVRAAAASHTGRRGPPSPVDE